MRRALISKVFLGVLLFCAPVYGEENNGLDALQGSDSGLLSPDPNLPMINPAKAPEEDQSMGATETEVDLNPEVKAPTLEDSAATPLAEEIRPLLIKENDGIIEIVTPFGPFRVMGDMQPHFKVGIPIDALRPKVPLAPPPSAPPRVIAAIPPVTVVAPPVVIVPPPPAPPAPVPKEEPPQEAKKEEKPEPVVQVPPPEYDDTDSLVVEANHLFNRRRFFEAYTLIERLLKKRPDFVRGWIMKGSLLHVQGHKELAKKAWEQAKTLAPQNTEIDAILQRYP